MPEYIRSSRSPASDGTHATGTSLGATAQRATASPITQQGFNIQSSADRSPSVGALGRLQAQANGAPLQGVFIIGEPLDGSYYNQFSVADAAGYLVTRDIASIAHLTIILTAIDQAGQANFTWATLEAAIELHLLTDDDKENIDGDAFDKALVATAALMHDDIEVDWQYAGNIAEAITRFVDDDSDLGFGIMVDVNEDDVYPDYDQYDADIRLGQRITLFTHELTYHGNLQAQNRDVDGDGDPDLDHRLIFLPARRDAHFGAFRRAVENEIAGVVPATPALVRRVNALIASWRDDLVHHIDQYGQNDPQKAEALVWTQGRFDVLTALVPDV